MMSLRGLPYNPHSFRKTLAQFGEQVCETPEAFKAWSQIPGQVPQWYPANQAANKRIRLVKKSYNVLIGAPGEIRTPGP